MEAKRAAQGATDGEAALLAMAGRHLLGNYRPAPIVLARGKGTEIWDVAGRRYLDFCAGVAVCCLGHAHPELERALGAQAGVLLQASNYFYNVENVQLAAELCAATGFDRVFFCNSGAEANEAMLKLARRHHHERGDKARVRLLAFEGAFHGRTMGALTLTGKRYFDGFGEPLAGVDHLPYGDLDAVAAQLGNDVAAIVVEPLQGEGGVLVPAPGFLRGLRELCDRAGALLCVDEVQTGMGRTGKLLALEHDSVRADVIALAKGLGGGFPIGAVCVREALAGALPSGSHGSTFGGNALGSVAARTVLRVLREERLIEAAAVRGAQLGAGLAALAERHPRLCSGERGLGLLRAVVLRDVVQARDLLGPAREHGLLLTAAGPRGLRFTPPLTVSEAEIEEALELAERTLAAVEKNLS
jgi:acetylornithine/N-succinyldiaminopimelate aminotransferase